MAWMDALRLHGLTNDDAERVTEGFRKLALACDQWPAPAALVRALPDKPRPYFRALPRPQLSPEEEAADKARRRALVEEAAATLRIRVH